MLQNVTSTGIRDVRLGYGKSFVVRTVLAEGIGRIQESLVFDCYTSLLASL